LNRWTPLLRRTISEEQIDEVLIRHPQLGRHFLEVVYRRGVKANRDLTLELLGVRILAGLGKIVLFSHLGLQQAETESD
jgi:hypothetical protein